MQGVGRGKNLGMNAESKKNRERQIKSDLHRNEKHQTPPPNLNVHFN